MAANEQARWLRSISRHKGQRPMRTVAEFIKLADQDSVHSVDSVKVT